MATEEEKPDTSRLVLKAKQVTPTDGPSRPGDPGAISVRQIHSQNLRAEEKARKDARRGRSRPPAEPEARTVPAGFKPREVTRTDAPAPAGSGDAIDVKDMLLENMVAEEEAGWGGLKRWRRGKSRRTRDFLLIMLGLSGAVGALMHYLPGQETLVYGFSAMVLAGVTLGWIMFFVVDKY